MRNTIIFTLIVGTVAAIFTLQNAEKIPVTFLFVKLDIPLALVILFSLALGAILGLLACRGKKKKTDETKNTLQT